MTTERTIEIFNDYDRISGKLIRGNSEDDSLFNLETVEAMNSINVILHKYQKIEKIVEEWDKDLIDYEGHYGEDYMEKIQGVLEDGKID